MSSMSNSSLSIRATVLEGNDLGITQAAQQLKLGKLVALPTETVYGLGANALLEDSVREIFRVKGRPLTDPLIVHVPSISDALELVELEGFDKTLFEALGGAFWPGGLTLIAKQRSFLPLCLSAGTGFVGIRVPNHPLALKLLKEAGCPIAAPSANRFGHVSPTTHQHVFNDLGTHDIFILNGDAEEETCKHGIESTVCKFDVENKELIIFRRGAVSQAQIAQVLKDIKLKAVDGDSSSDSVADWSIRVITKHVPMPENYKHMGLTNTQDNLESGNTAREQAASAAEETTATATGDNMDEVVSPPIDSVGEVAPGQLITHYAPDVPTFILRCQASSDSTTSDNESDKNLNENVFLDDDIKEQMMLDTVVIDFGGSLKWLSERCLAYHDMSPQGDVSMAGKTVFSSLRWSESVIGAKRVLIADIETVVSSPPPSELDAASAVQFTGVEHVESVADRAFRAASGRVISVQRGGLPSATY